MSDYDSSEAFDDATRKRWDKEKQVSVKNFPTLFEILGESDIIIYTFL